MAWLSTRTRKAIAVGLLIEHLHVKRGRAYWQLDLDELTEAVQAQIDAHTEMWDAHLP